MRAVVTILVVLFGLFLSSHADAQCSPQDCRKCLRSGHSGCLQYGIDFGLHGA